ncbi:TorF family putative porin [Thiothrix nivea]|uniref:Histidine kinase n=1 Tax=Thiothrix nivea (strain ATCC 35100 / DSM 5205 / JP2) TaxID=870187 RepID=A0A656HIH7_THINJ|nr:TorF family putative porin [Thiothrix nivea]EIJ35190.1 hypothetical protein Thini_2652 [Thiothrix nivea DSM 5205]
MKKNILLTATVLASLMVSAQAMAGASGNIGVTSNYIWRGVEQNNGQAAVSGGLDFEAPNGGYVGTWASPVAGGDDYELDLYGGYAGENASGLGYDVGVITYMYPKGGTNEHFDEVYGSLNYGAINGGVAYTFGSDDDTTPEFSKGDIYYHVGASKEIKGGLELGGTVGHYDFDDAAGEDYTHYQVSLSKDDFTFAVDDSDLTDSDPLVSVSWSKSIDF